MTITAISGSGGFIGKQLIRFLEAKGHSIRRIPRSVLYHEPEALTEILEGARYVIHLAGAPIIGRWTAAYKREIYESRIHGTRCLVQAMARLKQPPQAFISASAVGIYPTQGSFTEYDDQVAGNFLGKVCRDWEKEAGEAAGFTRTSMLRLGIVLGKKGGALQKMALPFRLFAGGPIGRGKQMISWIHIDDLLEVIHLIMSRESISGPVNATAPQVVSNREFSLQIGRSLKRPVWLPVPVFALKLLFGQGAMVLTRGQHAIPKKLQDAGFGYRFARLSQALDDLL